MSSRIVVISLGICQKILTENLKMCHIAAKFVPLFLTSDQKQRSVNLCLALRKKANEDPIFISRIIMVTKFGITVMIHKQSTSRRSERTHNHQSKKGEAGLEFNKEHANLDKLSQYFFF
jgi:hypothetical protein